MDLLGAAVERYLCGFPCCLLSACQHSASPCWRHTPPPWIPLARAPPQGQRQARRAPAWSEPPSASASPVENERTSGNGRRCHLRGRMTTIRPVEGLKPAVCEKRFTCSTGHVQQLCPRLWIHDTKERVFPQAMNPEAHGIVHDVILLCHILKHFIHWKRTKRVSLAERCLCFLFVGVPY